MGILEIDDESYRGIYEMRVAQLINEGYDLLAARLMANQSMSQCFRSYSTQIQCDVQKDYDDARMDNDYDER